MHTEGEGSDFLKRLRFFILCFLSAVLLTAPIYTLPSAALVARGTNIFDSILPNQQPRTPHSGTTTTVPDPADGMPALPREEDASEKAERGAQGGDQEAAQEAAPAPAGEGASVGVAVLVLGLAAIAVVLAIFYVFGRKNTHTRD